MESSRPSRAKSDVTEHPRGWTLLMIEAAKGNESYVRALQKNTLHNVDNEGRTALVLAVEQGHIETVHILIESKASIEVRTKQDMTPLMLASSNGNDDVVKVLLSAKAAVDAEGKNGWTAVQCAAEKGHASTLKLLIDAKATLSTTEGLSALALAAGRGHMHALQVLIDARAPVDAAFAGCSPVMDAVINRRSDVLHTLISAKASPDEPRDTAKRTPLMVAVLRNDTQMGELLLNSKAALEARDLHDTTPLMLAVAHGHGDCVNLLLAHRAAVDVTDKDGWTALLFAVAGEHREMTETLLGTRASPNVKDTDDRTPLIVAAAQGRVDLARALIKAKAALDPKDARAMSAFSHAAAGSHHAVVQLLLDAKATTDVLEIMSRNPSLLAEHQTHPEVQRVLEAERARQVLEESRRAASEPAQAHCARAVTLSVRAASAASPPTTLGQHATNAPIASVSRNDAHLTPLQLAFRDHRWGTVKGLIDEGTSVDFSDEFALSGLFSVTSEGNADMLRCLISAKADPCAQNDEHKSLLQVAVSNGFTFTAIVLVEKGATVDPQAAYARKALCAAANSGNLEMLRVLLAARASLDVSDESGFTPLQLAQANGHTAAVEVLKSAALAAAKLVPPPALFDAIMKKDIKTVQALLQGKAAVNGVGAGGRTPLQVAVQQGSVRLAKLLLQEGAEFYLSGPEITQALRSAALTDSLELLHLLIARKADVNGNEDGGKSPLLLAIVKRHPLSAGMLLKARATLNASDNSVVRELITAIKEKHPDTLKLLLDANADANTLTRAGKSLLELAIDSRHALAAQLLLDAGASTLISAKSSHRELFTAASIGDVQMLRVLIAAKANLDALNTLKKTALQVTIENCRALAAQVLIKAGATFDPNAEFIHDGVCSAAEKGNVDMLNLLFLAAGASIAEIEASGRSPLYLALTNKHADAIRVLWEADVSGCSRSFAMYVAAANDDSEILSVLVNAKVPINSVNAQGLTPVQLAVQRGESSVTQRLLAAGAVWMPPAIAVSPEYQGSAPLRSAYDGYLYEYSATSEHLSSYEDEDDSDEDDEDEDDSDEDDEDEDDSDEDNEDVALHGDFPDEMAEDFEQVCGEVSLDVMEEPGRTESIYVATSEDAIASEDLRVPVSATKAIDSPTLEGLSETPECEQSTASAEPLRSPLACAVIANDLDLAEQLIDAGASVEEPDSEDFTPLQLALQRGFTVMVKFLIAVGAALDPESKITATALCAAAYRGDEEMVRSLLEADVSVNVTDDKGCNPMYYASYQNHKDVMHLLQEAGAVVDPRIARLCDAAEIGNAQIVRSLIAEKVPVMAASRDQTPLLRAIQKQRFNVIKILVDAGAFLRVAHSVSIRAALFLAAKAQDMDSLRTLIRARADVNVRDDSGESLLDAMVRAQDYEAIRLLFDAGAKVSRDDDDTCEAVAYAIEQEPDLTLRAELTAKFDEAMKPKVDASKKNKKTGTNKRK